MSCARGCCPSPGEHYRSLRYTKAAVGPLHRKDQALDRDLAAYKRLIGSGLEPAQIDGAHDLERTDASAARIEGRPEGTLDGHDG